MIFIERFYVVRRRMFCYGSISDISNKKSSGSISLAMLRRGRDSHPGQAKRVEGGCRGLAQHDLHVSKQKNTYLNCHSQGCMASFSDVNPQNFYRLRRERNIPFLFIS